MYPYFNKISQQLEAIKLPAKYLEYNWKAVIFRMELSYALKNIVGIQ